MLPCYKRARFCEGHGFKPVCEQDSMVVSQAKTNECRAMQRGLCLASLVTAPLRTSTLLVSTRSCRLLWSLGSPTTPSASVTPTPGCEATPTGLLEPSASKAIKPQVYTLSYSSLLCMALHWFEAGPDWFLVTYVSRYDRQCVLREVTQYCWISVCSYCVACDAIVTSLVQECRFL